MIYLLMLYLFRPCDETFAGRSADSEPETQAVENALKNKTGNWDAYISIHRWSFIKEKINFKIEKYI